MTFLNKVEEKMRQLRIPFESIELSNRPDKRIKVVIDGNTIHFGSKHGFTFLDGASEETRNHYRARHSKLMLRDGRRAIDVKYSPAYLSWHVLWS